MPLAPMNMGQPSDYRGGFNSREHGHSNRGRGEGRGGYAGRNFEVMSPGPPIQRAQTANGPPGANLFIFHIPNDMTNDSLEQLFSPYGIVLSARIMIERETGRSRGFGYVFTLRFHN
jgi:RNA recognition motif-containing protein